MSGRREAPPPGAAPCSVLLPSLLVPPPPRFDDGAKLPCDCFVGSAFKGHDVGGDFVEVLEFVLFFEFFQREKKKNSLQ